MKHNSRILLASLSLLMLLSGCTLLSFYPLYTDDVLIKDDRLIGKWYVIEEESGSDTDTMYWEIKSFSEEVTDSKSPFDSKKVEMEKIRIKESDRADKFDEHYIDDFTYTLVMWKNSEELEDPTDAADLFKLHLVNLNGETYLDFFMVGLLDEWDNSIPSFHQIPVHTFAKIDFVDEGININWFDGDWFKQKLNENKIRIKHEVNSEHTLLTAQPKDLQKFVIKYADDPKAFEDGPSVELKALKH